MEGIIESLKAAAAENLPATLNAAEVKAVLSCLAPAEPEAVEEADAVEVVEVAKPKGKGKGK